LEEGPTVAHTASRLLDDDDDDDDDGGAAARATRRVGRDDTADVGAERVATAFLCVIASLVIATLAMLIAPRAPFAAFSITLAAALALALLVAELAAHHRRGRRTA
jgi:hypothetical protein